MAGGLPQEPLPAAKWRPLPETLDRPQKPQFTLGLGSSLRGACTSRMYRWSMGQQPLMCRSVPPYSRSAQSTRRYPKLTPDRFGKRGGNGSKTIGRWVRTRVGITDPRKAPNHSWRHRFADQCKKVGIPRELRFALEGHASSDVGDGYGSEGDPLRVLAAALGRVANPLEEM